MKDGSRAEATVVRTDMTEDTAASAAVVEEKMLASGSQTHHACERVCPQTPLGPSGTSSNWGTHWSRSTHRRKESKTTQRKSQSSFLKQEIGKKRQQKSVNTHTLRHQRLLRSSLTLVSFQLLFTHPFTHFSESGIKTLWLRYLRESGAGQPSCFLPPLDPYLSHQQPQSEGMKKFFGEKIPQRFLPALLFCFLFW